MNPIDINNKHYYAFNAPKFVARIKERLSQIKEIGMEVVGTGEFGIPDIMSGLYIEKVWNYSDKEWNDYIDWVKSLIKEKEVK